MFKLITGTLAGLVLVGSLSACGGQSNTVAGCTAQLVQMTTDGTPDGVTAQACVGLSKADTAAAAGAAIQQVLAKSFSAAK